VRGVNALITTDRVGRRYQSGETWIDAVCDVTIQISAGERVALTGPSGSGKSTLLALLGALELPTSGAIAFAGRDIASLDARGRARYRRHEIAFIFQSFRLLPHLTALENVALPAMLAGVPKATAVERASVLLDRVGLRERRAHRPTRLSAGEQQRVAAARALINGPRLLLADEPTGNLDAESALAVLDLIDELVRERSLTLLVATHSPEIARRAGRAVALRSGRIAS
jgi:putative ABC transport system ATP-binding protein